MTGALGIFLSLLVFPHLNHRFGTLPLFRTAFGLYPALYLLYSAMSILTRSGVFQKVPPEFMWTGVTLLLGVGKVAASMCFP